MATATAVRSPRGRSPALQAQLGRAIQRRADRAQAISTPRLARGLRVHFLALARRVHAGAPPPVKGIEQDMLKELTQLLESSIAAETKVTLSPLIKTETIRVLDDAHGAVQTTLGATFDLPPDVSKKAIADVGWRVKDITNETRAVLRNTVKQGIADGVHPSVTAQRLVDQIEGWGGGKDGKSWAHSRAYVIARTETAMVFNKSTIDSYKASGLVDQVETLDAPTCGWRGHNDPERAQGKIVSLDVARANPVSHPNCIRAYAPVVSKAEKPLAPPKPVEDPWAKPRDYLKESNHGGFGDTPMEKWASGWSSAARAARTEAQREALMVYQGSGYKPMNAILRGQAQPFTGVTRPLAERQQEIDDLTAYINGARTPQAVKVVRGVGQGRELFGVPPDRLKEVVGGTFEDKGFFSTAMSERSSFGGVQLHLTVPKGYPALPVSLENARILDAAEVAKYGPALTEAELLLQRGTKIVVDRVEERAGGRMHVFGRVMPRE